MYLLYQNLSCFCACVLLHCACLYSFSCLAKKPCSTWQQLSVRIEAFEEYMSDDILLDLTSNSCCHTSYHTFLNLTQLFLLCFQALIASYLSKGDYVVVTEITHYVLKVCTSFFYPASCETLYANLISDWTHNLQIGLLAGVFLAAALGVSFGSLSTLFTKDAEVLAVVSTGVLVCLYTIWGIFR